MGNYFKIFLALLLVTAVAAPAFALDVDSKGLLQIRAIYGDNLSDRDDSTDDSIQGVDERFRLWTNAAVNENLKAVFGIEFDYTWGDDSTGRLRADQTGQLEIMQAYLDFNLPQLNTNVKAGTQYYKLGRGFILGENASGVQIRTSCPVVEGNSLGFYWVKIVEGTRATLAADLADDAGDEDYYQIQYDLKTDGWHVAPYVGFYDLSSSDDAWYFGADLDGKVGDLGLAATFIYNMWDVAANDGNGIAAWAQASQKFGDTSLALSAAYYGDEDNDGQFLSIQDEGGAPRGFQNFAEVITSGKFGTHGGNAVGSQVADRWFREMNFMYVKLDAAQKIDDKNKVYGALIYAEEAEDTVTYGDARTYGFEVDAYYDYIIDKGLTLTIGGGYLFADSDLAATGSADDAYKVGTALTYQF